MKQTDDGEVTMTERKDNQNTDINEQSTSDLDQRTFQKVIAMFTPVESDFLGFSKEEVIQGPNDRAIIGCDTYFPVKWLVEDYGFTDEEARHFVNMVNKKKGDVTQE